MAKFEMVLIDADYTVVDGAPIVRLYGRLKDGRSVVVFDKSFEPYFYVLPKKDAVNLKKEIENFSFKDERGEFSVKRVEIIERTIGVSKEKVLAVFCNVPSDVPKVKDVVKEWPEVADKFEFDILFFRRYLMDMKLLPMGPVLVTGEEIKEKDGLRGTVDAEVSVLSTSVAGGTGWDFEPKVIAFDLETVLEGVSQNMQKIILASVYASTGYKKVFCYVEDGHSDSMCLNDEGELIKKLVETVKKQDTDFIVSYNGDAFDMTVLRDRARRFKVMLDFGRDRREVAFQTRGRTTPAIVRGRVHIDLFQFVSVIMRATIKSEILSLDAVANELLGLRKKEMTWEQMIDNWNKKMDLDKVAQYCLHDSLLALKLSELVMPNIFALSRLTGQVPSDVCRMTYGQLVESYAMRRASELSVMIPNRPSKEVIEERREADAFVGAFVVEPKPGLHENIAVFDFRSLYPSIIVSHNIDPATFMCECCKDEEKNKVPGTSYYFCTKKKGFLPTVLEELVEERVRVKKKMKGAKEGSPEYVDLYAQQYAIKTVSNAFYGYLGFAGSRWFRRECGESVTAFGRYYIHKVIDLAKSSGFDVVYGDTDSVFLKLKDPGADILPTAKKFLLDVNKTLPGIMELDFEGTFKRGIFVKKHVGEGGAKKRYALIDEKGNMKIRGFEKVRRDWSKLAKDTQENVLRLVLTDRVDEAVAYVKGVVARLKTGKVALEELGIYTSVKRELNDYEQTGPHVAAAQKAVKKGVKISSGQTIQYVITSRPGSISEKAELIQFAKDYDKDYYIKNQIIPAALRALSVFGITEDELTGNGKQSGLMRFTNK